MEENSDIPEILPLIDIFFHDKMLGCLRVSKLPGKNHSLLFYNFKSKVLTKFRTKYLEIQRSQKEF